MHHLDHGQGASPACRRPAWRFAGHGGTGPSWWPRPARTSIGAPLGPDLHQAQPHDLDRGRDDGHDAAPRSGGRGNELHHLSTQQTKKTVLLTVLFLDQGKNINEINIKTP